MAGTESHTGGTYNGTSYDTGIDDITVDKGNTQVYDLNGRQRTSQSSRGIYIIKNNKKNTKALF